MKYQDFSSDENLVSSEDTIFICHTVKISLPDFLDIEDITCLRVDTNVIFECSTRYRVEHEKIKFVSTSGHVIFCLLYRHR